MWFGVGWDVFVFRDLLVYYVSCVVGGEYPALWVLSEGLVNCCLVVLEVLYCLWGGWGGYVLFGGWGVVDPVG